MRDRHNKTVESSTSEINKLKKEHDELRDSLNKTVE